jgi:beta-N-acetylhexosaminidase
MREAFSQDIQYDLSEGNEIGFKGVLFSDDLSMKALSGTPEKNALDALSAGCDLAVHCNGDILERRAVLEATVDQLLGRENRLNYFFNQNVKAGDVDNNKLYHWLLETVKGYE